MIHQLYRICAGWGPRLDIHWAATEAARLSALRHVTPGTEAAEKWEVSKKTPFRLLKKIPQRLEVGGVSKRKMLQSIFFETWESLQMCAVSEVSFSIRFWMAVIRRVTAPCFSMIFMKISWQWHHRLLLLIGEEAVSARWRTSNKTGKLL